MFILIYAGKLTTAIATWELFSIEKNAGKFGNPNSWFFIISCNEFEIIKLPFILLRYFTTSNTKHLFDCHSWFWPLLMFQIIMFALRNHMDWPMKKMENPGLHRQSCNWNCRLKLPLTESWMIVLISQSMCIRLISQNEAFKYRIIEIIRFITPLFYVYYYCTYM